MKSGFNRQETLRLTGLTSNQLSYLEKLDLVAPDKSGHPKHPTVRYSAEQILEIQLIKRLRAKISNQEIKQALEFLKNRNYEPSLFEIRLLSFNSKLYWIEEEGNLQEIVVELTGKAKGQIVMFTIDPIGDVVSELWEEARSSEVLDFEKRARSTALETVKEKTARH